MTDEVPAVSALADTGAEAPYTQDPDPFPERVEVPQEVVASLLDSSDDETDVELPALEPVPPPVEEALLSDAPAPPSASKRKKVTRKERAPKRVRRDLEMDTSEVSYPNDRPVSERKEGKENKESKESKDSKRKGQRLSVRERFTRELTRVRTLTKGLFSKSVIKGMAAEADESVPYQKEWLESARAHAEPFMKKLAETIVDALAFRQVSTVNEDILAYVARQLELPAYNRQDSEFAGKMSGFDVKLDLHMMKYVRNNPSVFPSGKTFSYSASCSHPALLAGKSTDGSPSAREIMRYWTYRHVRSHVIGLVAATKPELSYQTKVASEYIRRVADAMVTPAASRPGKRTHSSKNGPSAEKSARKSAGTKRARGA